MIFDDFWWILMVFDEFSWFSNFYLFAKTSIQTTRTCADNVEHAHEMFVAMARDMTCGWGINKFIKIIKNHQISTKITKFQWFPLIFLLFRTFLTFPMRLLLLTWPAPPAWHVTHHRNERLVSLFNAVCARASGLDGLSCKINKFIKSIKNHQVSTKFIKFHWFPLSFLLFSDISDISHEDIAAHLACRTRMPCHAPLHIASARKINKP